MKAPITELVMGDEGILDFGKGEFSEWQAASPQEVDALLCWVGVAAMKSQCFIAEGTLIEELAKVLFVLMGRVGEAKALMEGGKNNSNGKTWNIKLDLYFFLPTLDLCSKWMQSTPFTIWSEEEKLKRVGVENTQEKGIYFFPSQEYKTF